MRYCWTFCCSLPVKSFGLFHHLMNPTKRPFLCFLPFLLNRIWCILDLSHPLTDRQLILIVSQSLHRHQMLVSLHTNKKITSSSSKKVFKIETIEYINTQRFVITLPGFNSNAIGSTSMTVDISVESLDLLMLLCLYLFVFGLISKSLHIKLLKMFKCLPLKYAFTPQVIGLYGFFYCYFISILQHSIIHSMRVSRITLMDMLC